MAKKTYNQRVTDAKVELACQTCAKTELRELVYKILGMLPVDLLTDYACEKLELMSHDQWMDAGADAASMRAECEG